MARSSPKLVGLWSFQGTIGVWIKAILEAFVVGTVFYDVSIDSYIVNFGNPIGLDPFCHGASLRLIVGCKFEISVTAILISISWFLDVMRIVVINNIG